MRTLAIVAIPLLAALGACEFDNFTAPSTVLEGRIVYQGEPLAVRQRAIELELWEDGYELRQPIAVSVHHDGTFSAMLFDGSYKLAHKPGVGPWIADQDTIPIEVRGVTTVDIPVTPYFMIRNATLATDGSVVTATFDVEQVLPDAELEEVSLFVGYRQFVDRTDAEAEASMAAADLEALTGVQLEIPVTDALRERGYLYARVGVKSAGVADLLYTQVQRLELN